MGQCRSQALVDVQPSQFNSLDYTNLDYNDHATYKKLEDIAGSILQSKTFVHSLAQQINESYSSLIQRIIAARQYHVLHKLSSLQGDEKLSFIQSIEYLDLETVDSVPPLRLFLQLYYHCYSRNQVDSFQGSVLPLPTPDRELGLSLIREQQVGIVFLAGGKCSRLPKKLLEDVGLPSHKCVLQILFERLRKIIYLADEPNLKTFPVCVLLSDTNGMQIRQFLKSKRDFEFENIHFIYQKALPVVNLEGQLLFCNNEPILMPNGCGSVYPLLNSFLSKHPKLKYVHLLGCENLMGLPLDPDVLGLEADVICKTIETQLQVDDKLYFHNGQFKSIEVQDSSMTGNLENSTLCLNDLYLNVQFFQNLKSNHDKSLKLAQRYHTIKRGQALHFETHIHDIMEIADNTILYPVEDHALLQYDFKRPLIQLSTTYKKWLDIEGSQEEQLVEVSANMSYKGEGLKKPLHQEIEYPLII